VKTVAITQRVDIIAERDERRDALDQRWHGFLAACDLQALILPNDEKSAQALLASTKLSGIILSGGNDLARFGGNVPERDRAERLAVDFAAAHDLPLLGVCRGMQFLADISGAPPIPITGHAGTRHNITLASGGTREVNSYHNYGITTLPKQWCALATASDGSIEWMVNSKMHGIMWHPEREAVPDADDVKLFRELFV
jgi:gamma-glutamyl-gamma-aminobutyrate hydrolase PuuD